MPTGSVIAFGARSICRCSPSRGVLLLLWLRQAWRRRATWRPCGIERRQVPVRERDSVPRRAAVLALPAAGRARRRSLAVARPQAADVARPHRRRGPRHSAGRFGVDARGRRRGQSLAAIDAVPPHARRVAALGRRSRRHGAVRAHRDAAGPADKDPNTYFFFLDHLERRSRRSGSRTTPRGTPTSSAASTGGCGWSEGRARFRASPPTPRRSC